MLKSILQHATKAFGFCVKLNLKLIEIAFPWWAGATYGVCSLFISEGMGLPLVHASKLHGTDAVALVCFSKDMEALVAFADYVLSSPGARELLEEILSADQKAAEADQKEQ